MSNRYVFLLSLLFAVLGFSTHLSAQAVFSVQSGNWSDPATWSADSVPGPGVDVIISSGDSVVIPTSGPKGEVSSLVIEEEGFFLFNDRDFTIYGLTEVSGTVLDTSNGGTNTFGGLVHIKETGRWNTDSVISTSRLVFENGILNEGDTMFLYSCAFDVSDQTLEGTSPIRFKGTAIIETGRTLTLDNAAGVVLTEAGEFRGRETGETLINKSLLVNLGLRDAVFRATADFSWPGNIVASGGNGSSRITQGIYDNLVILPDTALAFIRRRAQGPIEVNNRLWIQAGARFSTEQQPFRASRVDVNGIFYSTDSTMRIEIDTLNLSGGEIDGTSSGWPQVHVMDQLLFETGGGQISRCEFHMEAPLRIPAGINLVFGDEEGGKFFQSVEIEATGNINFQADGTRAIFEGPVHNRGSFSHSLGNYHFLDTVHTTSTGTFNGRGNESLYVFEQPFIHDGSMDNSRGNYVFAGGTFGEAEISIQGNVLVPDGEIFTNQNTGGLSIDGLLNGLSSTSVFVNAGRLVLRPSKSGPLPMEVGVFDPASVPGNWIDFASPVRDQKIPAGVYQSISATVGNGKLITGGDLEIMGDIHLESNISRDPFSLDLAHIIINGTTDQTITGSGEGVIQAIDVVKDSGDVIVQDAFVVQETISLLKGEVRTVNSFVGLSASAVITETELGYITGKLATTRSIGGGSTNEFGGMGLILLADRDKPLGQTLVVRTTGSSLDPDQIQRYFEITPTFNERLNAKLTFIYNDRDLAGAKRKELVLERSDASGGSFVELNSRNYFKDNELIDFFIDEFGTVAARPKTLRVKVFPSPYRADEVLNVEYYLPFDSPVTLSMYDRIGRLVYRAELDGITGKNSAEIPPQGSRAGTFYIHINTSIREGYAKAFKLAY